MHNVEKRKVGEWIELVITNKHVAPTEFVCATSV